MNEMQAIDIARRLAELGQTKEACQAYTLAIADAGADAPELRWEAALYILQSGGNYQVAYDVFHSLHRLDAFRSDAMSVMTQAFYEPNVKQLKKRYEKNCKLLSKYPYLFRRDFPPFEALPLRFYPYDDNRWLPYDVRQEQFGDLINLNHPVVSRNFFADLEKPILAADVFSQYELEYLNDNVRKSEWVGRENHIYLHYTDWETFCAYLQVWNLRPLLEEKKLVFLIGDEISLYPIDFKERFGIDYSQYPVKPFGIREINRLIWHTQLATHNGGDFFNEIFDGHPNLIAVPSVMLDNLQETLYEMRELLQKKSGEFTINVGDRDKVKAERLINGELRTLKNRTPKDEFVALFMSMADLRTLDPAARITPAIFFQPHFSNIQYQVSVNHAGRAMLQSEQYDTIRTSPVFNAFKYIKTFTPMRRPTTSTAATVRFMLNSLLENFKEGKVVYMSDTLAIRVLNRSFMIDPQDRLYQDSVLVRFEDGKLNPKATFTALAAFLDLPYTHSMTYCSLNGEIDPESLAGNDLGFSPAAIYRTYDDFMGVPERYYLEYFFRDAYEYYGYDFHYYDGASVDEAKVNELVSNMEVLNRYIRDSLETVASKQVTFDGKFLTDGDLEQARRDLVTQHMANLDINRLQIAKTLLSGLRFINKNGHPLRMMRKLQLDPALLEQPLYH